jgi:hypothetical protein
MFPADVTICAFEGAAPALTEDRWARLLAARQRKGSMLLPDEARRVVESDDGDDHEH